MPRVIGNITATQATPSSGRVLGNINSVSTQSTKEEKPSLLSSFASGAKNLGKSLVSGITDYGELIGEAGAQALRYATDKDFRNSQENVDKSKQTMDEARKKSQALIEQAKQTSDMTEKRRLLDQAKAISEGSAQEVEQATNFASKPATTFMNEEDIATRGDIALTGAKRTAAAAAYFIPGAGASGSIAKAALSGAATGALSGFAASEKGDEVKSSVLGALTGGVAGGALQGIGKALTKSGKDLIKPFSKAGAEVVDSGDNLLKSKLLGTLDNTPDLKRKSTVSGQLLRDLVGDLDKTDTRKLGNINAAVEELKDQVKAFSSYDDILSQAKKITGYDDLGNPGFLQRAKVETLAKSGNINIDDLSTIVSKYNKDSQFKLVPKLVKESADGIITDYRNTFTTQGQEVAAESLFTRLQDLESLKRSFQTAATRTPADEQSVKYLGFVIDDVKDKLDESAVKSGVLEILKDPDIIRAAEKQFGKGFAKKLSSVNSLRELRALESPWVLFSRGIEQILDRGPRGAVMGRYTGAAAGGTLGAYEGYREGGLTGAVQGAALGSMAGSITPTIARTLQTQVQPRLITGFSAGANLGSNVTSGVVNTAQKLSQGAGNSLLSPFIQKPIESTVAREIQK